MLNKVGSSLGVGSPNNDSVKGTPASLPTRLSEDVLELGRNVKTKTVTNVSAEERTVTDRFRAVWDFISVSARAL